MRGKGTGPKVPEAEKKEEPTVGAAAEKEVKIDKEDAAIVDKEGSSAAIPEEMPEGINMISVEDEGDEGVQSPEPAKVKMFRIIIDDQDNSDKNGPVRCTDGLGKQFQIKRGFEVDVPEGVVNVLRESVYEVIEKDEQDTEIVRRIPRYAMRIIKEL